MSGGAACIKFCAAFSRSGMVRSGNPRIGVHGGK